MLRFFRRCKNYCLSYSRSKDGELICTLRKILGYTPIHVSLYKVAFTHSSVGVMRGVRYLHVEHNERLEFLGDAIIGAIVSEFLYCKYPKRREGFLTQLRSKIVGREMLSQLALELGLSKYIKAHLQKPLTPNILGNTLEALMGAVYLDKGYACAREVFLHRILLLHVNIDELVGHEIDFKSRLLELIQKQGGCVRFETTEELREEKGSLSFTSTLLVNDEATGSGVGRSKKEAEQRAAEQAYTLLSVK